MAAMLEPVFETLRTMLLRAGSGMTVTVDAPGNLQLRTPWLEPGKKEPAWFAALQIKKNYVSVHLMPLYARPELVEEIPPELRKRMQGKSCFNFKALEPELLAALERLTARCAAAYRDPVAATPGCTEAAR